MSARRLALVTGGTSGIGLGAAKALLPHYDLALGYAANEEKARLAVRELEGMAPAGARVRAYKVPLRTHADALELLGLIQQDFTAAPLALVHSAGRIHDGLFMDLEFEAHAQIVQEHLVATMALTHACLKPMYRERFGRVVCLSSISARYAKRGQSNYAAAKAGLEGFVRTLALEVAHRGVTVNAVAPGLIDTPMTREILERLADPKELRKRVPAGYAGTPEDVGGLIAYLCAESSRYVTGQVVTIDGGRSLGDPAS